MPDPICSVDGCDRKRVVRRGYCLMHYKRWKRHGDPLLGAAPPPPAIRFWLKVKKLSADECWEWQAGRDASGYGRFCPPKGQSRLAHRFAYEQVIGPIPEGLELDHLCRNRACVNPAHLEAVTHQENHRRGLHGVLATHCKWGHEFNEVNTRWTGKMRLCIPCVRRRSREQVEKDRQARLERASLQS